MRLKRVFISVPILVEMFSKGTRAADVIEDAIPIDSVLCGLSCPDGRTIELTFSSPSFEEVADGCVIPTLYPQFLRGRFTE